MREHNGDAEASIGGGGGEEIMATVRELAELDAGQRAEPRARRVCDRGK